MQSQLMQPLFHRRLGRTEESRALRHRQLIGIRVIAAQVINSICILCDNRITGHENSCAYAVSLGFQMAFNGIVVIRPAHDIHERHMYPVGKPVIHLMGERKVEAAKAAIPHRIRVNDDAAAREADDGLFACLLVRNGYPLCFENRQTQGVVPIRKPVAVEHLQAHLILGDPA